MLEQLKSWFRDRYSSQRYPSDDELPPIVVPNRRKSDLRETRAHVHNGETLTPTVEKETTSRCSEDGETSQDGETRIESLGPGKNVLIRKKYVREDSGAHEALTILDDDLVDSSEVSGIDPYNTGGFDRSKNWDNRFRK